MTATTRPEPADARQRANDRAIGYWLFVCAAMVFAMVVIGGIRPARMLEVVNGGRKKAERNDGESNGHYALQYAFRQMPKDFVVGTWPFRLYKAPAQDGDDAAYDAREEIGGAA